MQDRADGNRNHRDQDEDVSIRKPALRERHQGLRRSRHDVISNRFLQAHGLIVRCIVINLIPLLVTRLQPSVCIDIQSASVRSVKGTAWQARHCPSLPSTGPRCVKSPSTTCTAQLSH